jgi:hypothetical protein
VANNIAHAYASNLEEMAHKLTAAKQKEQEMYNKHASDFAELGRTAIELNDVLEQHAQTVAALRDEKDEAVETATFFSRIIHSDFDEDQKQTY